MEGGGLPRCPADDTPPPGPDAGHAARCVRAAVAAVPGLDAARATAARISGGISNHLFLVRGGGGGPAEGVLVRLYGAGGPRCDRPSEEALVQRLSAAGFGPRVLGVFGGGRVEQFWPARRPLRPSESLQCGAGAEDFAAMVAVRLAELHGLRLVVPGRATSEEQLAMWLSGVAAEGPVGAAELRAAVAEVGGLRPTAQTAAEQAVEAVLLGRALCHLDLFAGNLLFDRGAEGSGGGGDVQFIDYEYAAEAPVGLDIANHISGRTELIEGEAVTFDTALYPTPQQQLHFLDVYIGARSHESMAGAVEAAEALAGQHRAGVAVYARRLLAALAAEAELRWVAWGLLQHQHSSVRFDYGDYAVQRWGCYATYRRWARREEEVGAATPGGRQSDADRAPAARE